MSSAAFNCNGYNRGKFNSVKQDALGYISNDLDGELDKHSEWLKERRNYAVPEGDIYPVVSTSEEGSSGCDEYYSSCEGMSYESQCEPKIQYNRNKYSLFDELDDCQSLDLGIVPFSRSLQQATSWTEKSELPRDKRRQSESYSTTGFPLEFRDKWSTSPAPIWQIPQSPVLLASRDPSIDLSNRTTKRTVIPESFKGLESGSNCEIIDSNLNEFKDGSYLFATADNEEWLKLILCKRGLDVYDVRKTETPGILAVLFRTHESAKQAFTTQKEIGVRMVPHSSTRRYWYKNPSPKFHVIYETTRRLTVKSGKSFSNRTIGDFLMKSARMERGCIIWADQMKGYRLRVVGFVGKFLRRDGRIITRTQPPSPGDTKVIGWVSTQCKDSKEKFVLRITGKQIEDYLYNKAWE